MDKESAEKIKALADMLIGTLGANVAPKDADKTVREVALVMYNDLLGIEGEIKTSGMYLCMRSGTGGGYISSTKFTPSATPKDNSN